MGYKVIDIYKTFLHVIFMKLKDVLSKISKNKINGQSTTCLRQKKLKEVGISENDLLNMKIDTKLKRLLFEE